MRQQRGQQHPELGLIQPEASEDIAFACGKTPGEGLGQDLDPLASFQSGWAESGLDWFFLFLWDSVEKDVFKEALFSCGCDPFGLWGAGGGGGGGGRAGQRFLESNLLHRGYTLENPRRITFEEPPGRWKGEAYERAQTLSLLIEGSVLNTSIQPGSTVPLALETGLEGGGEWLSPVSGGRGVSLASFVWVWPLPVRDRTSPGAEQTAEQSPPEAQ